MGRYGTRERELDDLLRREVFVDLYRVVRNGVRVSRPGYGLKELEAFLDFERQAEVKDGGASIVIFEQWMQTASRRCSTRSTPTTARTASRRGSCATGCSSGAPRRSRSSGRSRCPSRTSRSRSRR